MGAHSWLAALQIRRASRNTTESATSSDGSKYAGGAFASRDVPASTMISVDSVSAERFVSATSLLDSCGGSPLCCLPFGGTGITTERRVGSAGRCLSGGGRLVGLSVDALVEGHVR